MRLIIALVIIGIGIAIASIHLIHVNSPGWEKFPLKIGKRLVADPPARACSYSAEALYP